MVSRRIERAVIAGIVRPMLTRRMTTIALLLIAWPGCGNERPPAEACEDFLELICARSAECTSTSQADCLKGFGMTGMCSSVTHVSDTYDACMSALRDDTCSTLFTVTPSSSMPVFTQPDTCVSVLSR